MLTAISSAFIGTNENAESCALTLRDKFRNRYIRPARTAHCVSKAVLVPFVGTFDKDLIGAYTFCDKRFRGRLKLRFHRSLRADRTTAFTFVISQIAPKKIDYPTALSRITLLRILFRHPPLLLIALRPIEKIYRGGCASFGVPLRKAAILKSISSPPPFSMTAIRSWGAAGAAR